MQMYNKCKIKTTKAQNKNTYNQSYIFVISTYLHHISVSNFGFIET